MIHIFDAEWTGKTYCGLTGAEVRERGEKFLYVGIVADADADCPTCNPTPRPIGTPLSQLSGRPGEPGFERFRQIGESWGYE